MNTQHPILSLLMRINHLCFAKSFKHMSAHGIYPGQVPILKMLYDRDGQAQKDLIRKGMVKPSTVTVTLQRMERAGLILRRPDPEDARQSHVFITDKGRNAIEEADSVITALSETMLASLADAEKQELTHLLTRMAETLTEGEDSLLDCEGGTPTC